MVALWFALYFRFWNVRPSVMKKFAIFVLASIFAASRNASEKSFVFIKTLLPFLTVVLVSTFFLEESNTFGMHWRRKLNFIRFGWRRRHPSNKRSTAMGVWLMKRNDIVSIIFIAHSNNILKKTGYQKRFACGHKSREKKTKNLRG